ncbi:MAG: DUF4274 domain-containing protein [Candidatus Electrothrix aestuarii]|uniref:DUF4274 domain-containing protein n=1 Tax=Candidatus Electrothrix aestuarii TaxID=3062594 RepID=A0AAU8LTE7_9BACT|nr:DUF4274 domain-containing protein [Candidatus Electrothrix aestuarii]
MSVSELTQEQLRRLNTFTDDLVNMDLSEEQLFSLLEKMTSPEELYYLPWLINWDDELAEKTIDWILESPLCDAGTALSIYWLNQPVDSAGKKIADAYDDWERRKISLHLSIEQRIKSMSFPSAKIQYDPKWHWAYWNDEDVEDEDIAGIPEYMKAPTPGRKIADIRELPWNDIA